jgi:diamine N-acetyltransferase
MTDASFRTATVDDSALVARLFEQSFVETFGHLYAKADLAAFVSGITPESFAEEIADPGFVIRIAEVDGEAVGFAKLGPPSLPDEPPPATIELRQIYVLKPWQGTGIAKHLYDWAEAEALERGARHIQLTVYIDNDRARRFYGRRGFAEAGRYDFLVGNHVDEDIIMRKSL